LAVDFQVAEDLAAGRLVQILTHYDLPELPVSVIWPTSRNMSAALRAFVDFLGESDLRTRLPSDQAGTRSGLAGSSSETLPFPPVSSAASCLAAGSARCDLSLRKVPRSGASAMFQCVEFDMRKFMVFSSAALTASLLSAPLMAQAMDDAVAAARNQLGLLEYCQSEGHIDGAAVEAQTKMMALL